MRKLGIVTVDLGWGDSSKGSVTEYLCRQYDANLVVRYCGGSQAAHTVVLPEGKSHTYAQWGSGTHLGVPTYLGPAMIVNLPAMVNESVHLQEVMGVENPFDLLTVDPYCLVSTKYHRILNMIKEESRENKPHGSCAHGIAETREYWLKYGNDAIKMIDTTQPNRLHNKMELLRQRLAPQITSYTPYCDLSKYLPMPSASEETDNLLNIGRQIRITRPIDDLISSDVIIFEGAQGVLLDETYGFYPHTTWSTVTPYHAREMMSRGREIYTLGITRAYATRHGAGPFPTEAPAGTFGEDPHNPYNKWQGNMRYGYLDLPLLRYAADVVRFSGPLDGIAVNHLDYMISVKVAVEYEKNPLIPCSLPSLRDQEHMGELLDYVKPVYVGKTKEELLESINKIAPVVIEGYGPTHKDKTGKLPL